MYLVTSQNWNHCGFKTRQLRAFVGMGAVPGTKNPSVIYSVTVGDEDFREIYQQDFDALDKALDFINGRYGEWDFYDLGQSGGGCGSCSAH